MARPGGANRLELECQILCSALRQSWADTDAVGVVKVCQELYQLFPDLLPPPKNEQAAPSSNYYDLLQIECDVNPSMVTTAYFRKLRQVLKEGNSRVRKTELIQVMNAGSVLRSPRLRLSHDLIFTKAWMVEHAIDPDGTESFCSNVESEQSGEEDFRPPLQVVNCKPGDDMVESKEEKLPMLIDLLKATEIIGPAEVQALKNQMALYPDIALVDLVLRAGYVTSLEMKTLQLAEYMLASGKITMGQFAAAMFDERSTGDRSPQPRDDGELPPPAARVPKRPKPSGDQGDIKLVPPKPPEADPDVPKD